MYYRTASRERKRKAAAIRFLVFGAVILSILFFTDRKIRPIIRDNAAIQAKIIATKALNEAVVGQLDSLDSNYSSLIHIQKNEDGKIVSIETDTATVSKIQAKLTQSVMQGLDQMAEKSFPMSLGTLLQPEYFAGRGPKFKFYLQPSGYVTTKMVSHFSDAGINQTHHEIIFEISVPISAAIPGYHSTVSISTNFILADTVIVGEIPEYYTNVITEDQNMVGDLNDYSPGMPSKSQTGEH